MGKYLVEMDGKKYNFEGDHAPTESEARAAIAPAAKEAPKAASGPLETTVGAVASGLLKGGEGMLYAAQGVENLAAGVVGQQVPQDLAQLAKETGAFREATFGTQESIHGKVLESIAALPSVIAMMEGGGGGIGMAMAKFGALDATITKGVNKDATMGDMAWSAGKGAATGAILGKAAAMGTLSGNALAGGANAVAAAIEGGDANDIIAGAIVGAGVNTMSNPKNLARVWSGIKSTPEAMKSAVEEVATTMATEGKNPIQAVESIVGKTVNNYVADIKAMNEAPDKIQAINEQLKSLKDEKTTELEIIKNQSDRQALLTKEAKDKAEKATELGLTKTQREQNDREIAAKEKTDRIKTALDKTNEVLEGQLDQKTLEIAKGIKRGGVISKLFERMYSAYDAGLGQLSDAIGKNAPITVAEATDALTTLMQRWGEAGTLVDSPMAKRANKYMDILLERGKDDLGVFKTQRGSSITSADLMKVIAQAAAKGGKGAEVTISGKPVEKKETPLAKTITFERLKAIFDDIKSSAQYGSHDADIVRITLGDFAARKLNSREFYDLQESMSNALSMKQKLSETFQVQKGSAYFEGAHNYLSNLFKKGQGDPEMLRTLEKGMKIGEHQVKGLGDITSDLRAAFDTWDFAVKNLTRVGNVHAAEVMQLGQEFTARIATAKQQGKLTQEYLEKSHDLFKAQMVERQKQINDKYDLAMKEAQGNKKLQEELDARRREIGNTINDAGYLTGGLSRWVGAALKFSGRLLIHKHATVKRSNLGATVPPKP